ncbi:DUF806 family protein [Lactobacillus plantarum]|uniref:DUF806 family protein n=1 Tax=Lactiplantibacillus plantarum TaxID=1590 RepID=UPI00143DC793|nr:DUF806 family protein [Lactiplantibacillus plantarum]MBE1727401.1 DUF806 family protein [Lactiplantibacillus plantarum]NKI39450.1 DUF806 family protein [Lactiplantibacillus plantarum]
MTSAAFIRSILVSQLDWIPQISADHVHTFFIPESDNSDDALIVVISEIPDDGQSYGNDTPFETTKQVQLQFYYPDEYSEDMDLIENTVKKVLLENRIRCFSDAGHIRSPDSKNITNTLKFKYIKEAI